MSEMSLLLNLDDLKRWYGTERKADVVRYLERDRVHYTTGKNGAPCTTLAAIHRALLGDKETADEFDFSVAS